MEKNINTQQLDQINGGLGELASIYATRDELSLSNADIRLAESKLSQEKKEAVALASGFKSKLESKSGKVGLASGLASGNGLASGKARHLLSQDSAIY